MDHPIAFGCEHFTAHDRAVLGAGSIPNHEIIFSDDRAEENYAYFNIVPPGGWSMASIAVATVVRHGDTLYIVLPDLDAAPVAAEGPEDVLVRLREMAWQASGWA